MEDVMMVDIDDDETVQSIALEISSNRKDQHQLRRNQPYDILNQKLPAEIRLMFIVDTNFAISHLTIVKTLVELYDTSKCLVLIPWVVVQELDGLKSASKTYGQANLALLARNAVSFIHETLASGKAGLRGQKISECLDREADFGDDAILDCARYWHERQRVDVVMLSNDKNLCTKFMIHGLGAISYEMGLKADKLLARILRHWQPNSPEQLSPDDSMAVDDNEDDEDDDDLVLFTTPPTPVEMQTDPILPPIVKASSAVRDDPFAALSAKAGQSKYERSAHPLPLRQSRPARRIPTAARGEAVSRDDPLGRLLLDVERTMCKVLPDLIRAALLDELHDPAAVEFLYPSRTGTGKEGEKEEAEDVVTLIRLIYEDHWLTCFSRLLEQQQQQQQQRDGPKTRRSADAIALARELTDGLSGGGGGDPDKVVAFFSRLWQTLSRQKSAKYLARRDRYMASWRAQLASLDT